MKYIIEVTVTPVSTNDKSSDRIVSKSPTKTYNEGWERVFGKAETRPN